MRALLLALLAGACSAPAGSPSPAPPAGPPNIVFIYADDHAAAALGCYGSPVARTPNLDRLAEEGALFEAAFCTNGICAPSRAVVLTGTHSHVNGVRTNADHFDGDQTTFPKLLQAAGYQTALIGKWHLKSDPTGFDHWEVLPGQGHYYSPEFVSPAGKVRYPGYVTDVTTDRAIEWLEHERDPARPFLLMVQHKAPHRTWMPGPEQLDLYAQETLPEPSTLFDDYATRTDAAREQEMTIARHMDLEYDLKVPPLDPDAPRQGPARWAAGLLDRMTPPERARWEAAFGPRNAAFRAAHLSGDDLVRWKYQRYIKNYLRCIASIDENVGRLLDELERAGLADRTIVVYSSDQGFFLGEHGWFDKRFMYEPALRLPLLVRWPGVTPAGSRIDALVQNLDLAPTFLAAAGVAVPERMQGRSLVPLLAGDRPADWRGSIYYHYYEVGIHAVQPHEGVRTERYKLIRFLGDEPAYELYDLASDPDEVQNRWDDPALAGVRADLLTELERLREEYAVPPGE